MTNRVWEGTKTFYSFGLLFQYHPCVPYTGHTPRFQPPVPICPTSFHKGLSGSAQYPQPLGVITPWCVLQEAGLALHVSLQHKGSLAHNVSFWAQKLHHLVSFWPQNNCCTIFTISGPRNCSFRTILQSTINRLCPYSIYPQPFSGCLNNSSYDPQTCCNSPTKPKIDRNWLLCNLLKHK